MRLIIPGGRAFSEELYSDTENMIQGGITMLKAWHLISMVTWFAGLFYLPRLYVYHAPVSYTHLTLPTTPYV